MLHKFSFSLAFFELLLTPCSLARGSSVQTSECHKSLGDVLTSKLRRRPRVNEQHGVSQDSLPFTTIFLPEFKHNFLSLPDFAFDSFTLWISPNFYVSPRCFLAFKMGVIYFRACTNVRAASTYFYSPSFYRRYFIFAGRTPRFIFETSAAVGLNHVANFYLQE